MAGTLRDAMHVRRPRLTLSAWLAPIIAAKSQGLERALQEPSFAREAVPDERRVAAEAPTT